MLVDRHPPADPFALVPKLMAEFEPVLRTLDRLLDDDPLFQRVEADLDRRAPHSLTRGRPGTPVEAVLRLLAVKRLYGWSYGEVERFVGDSLALRQFCRVYLERVPDDTTLLRWANLIEPATLVAPNERVVALARGLQVTRGRKLRLDGTVAATPIHHPSDSGLLADGVRVLSRLLRRARAVLGEAAAGLSRGMFRTRTRSARRLVRSLHRLGRRKGDEAGRAMRRAYGRLITLTRKTRRQAARVGVILGARADAAAQRLARQVEGFLPRVERAIAQTIRRVLKGEAVPAPEKIVGLFEPHTQVIVRHKAGQPVEFGRQPWLEEVEGGIVSGWRLLEAPGRDAPQLVPRPAAHRQRFGKPPRLLTADRGAFSPRDEAQAERAGVRRVAISRRRGERAARPSASGRSVRVGSGAACASVPGSRAGSACCSAATGSIAAATTASAAWAAGSAGGSWPPTSSASPGRWRHGSKPKPRDRRPPSPERPPATTHAPVA